MRGTTARRVLVGWSKASCTKKTMITTHPARNRRKFFRPNKFTNNTNTHI
jgi:hypothetical protein